MTTSPNSLKTTQTTMMGTRDLAYFQIDMNTDVTTDYATQNSLYTKAVRALQTLLELYAIGEPNGNWFTVVASARTAPFAGTESAGDTGHNSLLRVAINDACGVSCQVWNARLRGYNIENDC